MKYKLSEILYYELYIKQSALHSSNTMDKSTDFQESDDSSGQWKELRRRPSTTLKMVRKICPIGCGKTYELNSEHDYACIFRKKKVYFKEPKRCSQISKIEFSCTKKVHGDNLEDRGDNLEDAVPMPKDFSCCA